MTQNAKRYFLIGLIMLLVFALCAVVVPKAYKLYTHINAPYITVTNGVELIDSDGKYKLQGVSNLPVVKVSYNNCFEEQIPVLGDAFEVVIDLGNLSEGWNYIELSGSSLISRWEIRGGGFINIVPFQASVFIPCREVERARSTGHRTGSMPYMLVDDYVFSSSYLDKIEFDESDLPDNIELDVEGIPVVKYSFGTFYNPVTIAQNALGYYGTYLRTTDNTKKESFLRHADWLLGHMTEEGSYPYPFSFPIAKGITLPEGFISGMAEGQALSVLVRAYYLTNDVKYLEGGEKVLDFMTHSADEDIFSGASRTLNDICVLSSDMSDYADNKVFEEYVFAPSIYVLNGDLFALLGLADWAMGPTAGYGKEKARNEFDAGIRGIEVLLPYYDFYGWSSYSLLQYTAKGLNLAPVFDVSYAHKYHIDLLYILADLSGSDVFSRYATRFIEYYDDPFWSQADELYRAWG